MMLVPHNENKLQSSTVEAGGQANDPEVKIKPPADDPREYNIFRFLKEDGKEQCGFCESSPGSLES